MAEQAWESVSPATLKHCWEHTRIQRPRLPKITLRYNRPQMPSTLAAGWDIVTHFATEQWTVPEVHSILQERLGDQYTAGEWDEPLDTVLGAEGDADAALAALAALHKKWAPSEPCDERLGPDRVRPPVLENQLGLAIRVEENMHIPEGWQPSPPSTLFRQESRTRAHSATKLATRSEERRVGKECA